MGCCSSKAKTTPIVVKPRVSSKDNDLQNSNKSNQGSVRGSVKESVKGSLHNSINVAEYRRKVSMKLVQHNTVGVSPQLKSRSQREHLKQIDENLKD